MFTWSQKHVFYIGWGSERGKSPVSAWDGCYFLSEQGEDSITAAWVQLSDLGLLSPYRAAPWADSHPFLVRGALGHGTVVPLVLGLVCSELWPQSPASALARWVLCGVCPHPWAEVFVPLGQGQVVKGSWVSSATITQTQIAFYTA